MKIFAIAAVACSILAAPASAALVADFQLNNSLADSLGGPSLVNNGATLGATGLTFSNNQGPTLNGFSNSGVYSIVVEFSFDSLGGYQKIVDFKSRASDTGLYVLGSDLTFYPEAFPNVGGFTTSQLQRVILTRDAGGTTVGYVGGNAVFNFVDSGDLGSIDSELAFFQDDFATGEGEAGPGFVNYIQIYGTALSAGEVANLGVVPEPSSWAMMIAGFGLVGAAMRRRAAAVVAA